MKTTRLEVTMSEVLPAVVRVLDVPAGVLLPELHDLLQAALGWTDSHLHQFVAGDICYGVPDLDGPDDERDESAVALRALPNRFAYLYDFGDGWEHEVVVVGPGGDWPGVVSGEGACPPEDVGGPHGYVEFRRVIADPDEPEYEHFRTWAGSWNEGFDLDATDLLVRQTVGVVPAPVRLVLGLAVDGVKLTPGGRLPRALVREVQEVYPSWNLSDRPASIEEDLPPLAALHDLLRHVGLLRLYKGTLGPTRAAADDLEVIRRLRSWFGPGDGFVHMSRHRRPRQPRRRGPLPTRRACRSATTGAWRSLGHQPRTGTGCGSGPSGVVQTAVHSGGVRPHSERQGIMDRRSFSALAVAAGDGAGRHMVKMAYGVVMGRRRGKVTKSASPRCDFFPA